MAAVCTVISNKVGGGGGGDGDGRRCCCCCLFVNCRLSHLFVFNVFTSCANVCVCACVWFAPGTSRYLFEANEYVLALSC